MKHFREIGREGNGVLVYVENCTNAGQKGHTPSESVARRHLKGVITSAEDYDGGIVATALSSHTSRVSSLVEFAKDIDRQPVLLGRSMEKYSGTTERLGFVDLPDDLGMYGHRKSVDRAFRRIMKKGKEDYPSIATGYQGEPHVMLTCTGRGETPYEIDDGDKVTFSARVILEPMDEGQRYQFERLLRIQGVRIYDEIHVSGHLREEDHYEMPQALQPQHVIPAHRNLKGFAPYVDLAESQGYALGRDLHVTRSGNMIQPVER